MPTFREDKLPYTQLLLDPNNYRYQDSAEFVYADEKRFHEINVQDRAYKRLRKEESLTQLKESIKTNGFIPVERLVVRPYSFESDKYLVLEGNRRLATLRWIADENDSGMNISQSVLDSLKEVPVIVVENDDDKAFYESLMGVRHVSGIKEWGGYQRAKLVATLRDTHKLDTADVARRIGMSANEVNRRYRAYKALQQMQQDEDFGAYVKPEMYPLFHEAVSLPNVREWLGWDENKGVFTNHERLEQFYQLIIPLEPEDGQAKDAKITSREEIRELRDILPNAEAKRILLDPSRSFFDAVSVAKRDELSRSWITQVAEAIAALHAISILDLQEISTEELAAIEKLREITSNLLITYNKLKS